jgi:hypothetical protein
MALALVLVACVGTTGGEVIDFPVAAVGADGAGGRDFSNDRGWHVVLTKAVLRVGAIYLTQVEPVSGSQPTPCELPGTYVAQLTTGMAVDLLAPAPQRFPALAHGTTLEALSGQVWLSGDADHDLDQVDDTTPVLEIAGTADKAGVVRPFSGTITIAENRAPADGALAGAGTICKQRIVSPIPTQLTIRHDGGLLLRIDPRALFVNVDFGALPPSAGGTFVFSDDPSQTDQPSTNLYANLHATGSLFTFEWSGALP